ncbi:sensor histidine kinase [Pseudobacter ginsenosidimutans]|uniref:histidine kinase n=1 Tax=Pseudobacter ginsenosidimutans TaxID=661488 RepID=A0A4Q7MSE5_9BACT|nr:ATP-binding protein [Pseudobacter ginsenosidimutans]QEC41492.1 hypothetical protein FSB84_07205 [Pseudobacter ginsenosidimutans]RZS71726.1 hypothetical protein EV199_3634 [Pseudobacter ginsenosidimutans]
MSSPTEQIVVVIVAVVAVLLFLAVLFLVMVMHHNSRRKQMAMEKLRIQELYENQLLESRLEIQQQTFHFISQEIHDNVGQILSLAKVELNILQQQLNGKGELVNSVRENVGKAMTELREIAKSLNHDQAQHFNWLENIREEINRINKSGAIAAELRLEGEEDCYLKDQQKLITFRVVQEGLQNILKHAGASSLLVRIHHAKEHTNIMIVDNGVGFDTEAALKGHSGLGLKNILNRVALIGGNAQICSAAGEGTCLCIRIAHG